MSKKRTICVITGTRADYGILHPVLDAIRKSRDLRLKVIATCMHLMPEFGYTAKEIINDGFDIYEKVDISYIHDTGEAMGISVGKAVSKLTHSFAKLRPDIVIVTGDRGEMLAAAIAANYLKIPVAQIHGGEISGHLDDVLRHAITKLSHLHFAPTMLAGARILKMGEEKRRVYVTGAPALDRIVHEQLPTKAELIKRYKIPPGSPFAILVQHPVALESEMAAQQMRVTLEAIKALHLRTIVCYPNADTGGRKMIGVIKKYASNPLFQIYENIPHLFYLGLLKMASVLVGNSSSGIIESPSFKVPVVNIGSRQQGRERSANIIDVPHDKQRIIGAIKKALHDNAFKRRVKHCVNHYGNGSASSRIVRVLQTVKLDGSLLQKRMTY